MALRREYTSATARQSPLIQSSLISNTTDLNPLSDVTHSTWICLIFPSIITWEINKIMELNFWTRPFTDPHQNTSGSNPCWDPSSIIHAADQNINPARITRHLWFSPNESSIHRVRREHSPTRHHLSSVQFCSVILQLHQTVSCNQEKWLKCSRLVWSWSSGTLHVVRWCCGCGGHVSRCGHRWSSQLQPLPPGFHLRGSESN